MNLTLTDWAVIAGYFLVNLGIGLYYRSRATRSTEDFFVGGRSVSWWLAGTSMVATTFAADTPLAVTGLVASYGIAGNWLWWNMLMSNMLTVFFFARLWRRSGRVPARVPGPLPGHPYQLHHPRLGQPGHGEDPHDDLQLHGYFSDGPDAGA